MDNDQQVRVIQARLDALEGMPLSDDRSAREAFTHVMVTVSRINELSAKARAQAMVGWREKRKRRPLSYSESHRRRRDVPAPAAGLSGAGQNVNIHLTRFS